jgi:acyl dehydratase
MALAEAEGVEGMKALAGREVGPSEWRTVSQAEIDAFAELSGDHQWIHVDPERAKAEIRFPAPVPIDTRVRAKAEVVSVEEVGGGWWQVVTRFTLEAEVAEKPCFVGDSVTRVLAAGA